MKKKNMLTDNDLKKMKKVPSEHDKYVEKERRFYLSYQLRIVLMILLVILLGVCSFICFTRGFSVGFKKTLLVSKNVDIDSEVRVIDQGTFQYNGNGGNIYLSNGIDDIDLKLKYYFYGNFDGQYYYKERIDAVMELKDDTGKVITNTKYSLLPEKVVNNDSMNQVRDLEIEDIYSLNYDYYNKIALDIQKSLNKEITGNLTLYYAFDVIGNIEGFSKDIKDNQVIKVNIPLMSNNVVVQVVDTDLESVKYSNSVKPRVIDQYILDLGIVLMIVDVIIILMIISFVYATRPKKSKYCRLRDGILRDYGDIIVTSKKIPKIENYNIVDCYSFSELLDAQRLIDKPIVYYEIVRNQKCMFVLIGESDIYKFTLKECDIDY